MRAKGSWTSSVVKTTHGVEPWERGKELELDGSLVIIVSDLKVGIEREWAFNMMFGVQILYPICYFLSSSILQIEVAVFIHIHKPAHYPPYFDKS